MNIIAPVVNPKSKFNSFPYVFLLLCLANLALSAAQGDSFDEPLKKSVVDFGKSPYYPKSNVRIRLSCYSYSTFLVKEYDEGEKGAAWLAIAPSVNGTASPCAKSHIGGEKVIKDPEWNGYFEGAKGNLVFFRGDDGVNGGMPFVVYDSRAGRKIIEDSYYDVSMWNKKAGPSPFDRLRVNGDILAQASLRYLRVVETDCDLRQTMAACWEQVRKKFELKNSPAPVCIGYEKISTDWPSAVAYPVEVTLSPQPKIKTIDGPLKCWPVD